MESQKSNLSPQTELEKLRSKFFQKGISYYKELMKEGLKRFDKSGDLEIVNADGTSYMQSGDKFIEELIKYFESKDSGPYYRMCADLKKLLNVYFKKFPQKKYKSNRLTALEKAKLDLYYAHLHVYHQLRQYGPNLFEEDGAIITKDDNGEYRRDGRDYIMKIIKFFEEKDRSIYYKMCAKLKNVLDDYDAKFGKKEVDNI
jgi:hypothetical protein